MSKKTGITIERHEEIGEQLRAIKQFLTKLQTELGNAYPVSGEDSRPYILTGRAKSYIDKLCSRLEDQMFSQHRDEINSRENPNDVLRFYYGAQEKDIVFECDA